MAMPDREPRGNTGEQAISTEISYNSRSFFGSPTLLMRRLALIVSIALLLIRPPAVAQGLVYDLFAEYLEPLRTQAGIPGMAAAIVGPDRIVWERAYGWQDIAASIATRLDTPFHVDGLTQVFTAALALRCVEERQLYLDESNGPVIPSPAEPGATIRQLLTHTSGLPGDLIFMYRPQRLDAMKSSIRACTDDSYRETVANLLARFAMTNSVPGADIVNVKPGDEGVPSETDKERYREVLARLAVPYAIDARGRASISQYSSMTLTPSSGLITTVRDFANFDAALKDGSSIVHAETLAEAWRAPVGRGGQPLPHGMGWFVQTYNGETVVWQFGVNLGGSSLLITVPSRGLTLILLANSDRLVKPLPLTDGDVTVSPFAKLFLSLFVRQGAGGV